MKLKTLSLIAGTLALTVIATPFAVQAQTGSPSPQPHKEWHKNGPYKSLNLTPDQKAQIKTIHESTRSQIQAVLTPAQQAQLKAERAKHKAEHQQGQHQGGERKKGGMFGSLNLSADQKAQIKQIRESEKQQVQAVLTPDQQAKMKKIREEWRSKHQQNKPQ